MPAVGEQKGCTMNQIRSLFAEVKYELMKILLMTVILEAAVVFLAVHLVLSIFTAPVWYSAVVAGAFAVIRFWRQSRKFDLRRIEDRNPELREMLRTANDNRNDDSLMAHALFHEVLEKMKRVSSGTFLDLGKVIQRVAAIFILSMILVSLAFFNINIAKFSNPLEEPLENFGKWIGGLGGGSTEQEVVNLGDDSLYGEARMARLSEDVLNVQINPSLNQIDFSDVQDPDDLGGAIKDFPGEAEAVSDESYAGGLEDVADRKTAAEYSQQVKQQ